MQTKEEFDKKLELARMRFEAAGLASLRDKTDEEISTMRKEYEDFCLAYRNLQAASVRVSSGNEIQGCIKEFYSADHYIDLTIPENRKWLVDL